MTEAMTRPASIGSLSGALLALALTVPIAASQGAAQGAGRGPGQVVPLPGRGPAPPPPFAMPLVGCGSDETLPQPISLTWSAIALAADSRLYVPCSDGPHTDEHREMRDARVLEDAWRSPVSEFRAQAVAAYGRLGRPEYVGMPGGRLDLVADRSTPTAPIAPTTWVPGVLLLALDDPAGNVRREAANAIGNALSGTAVEPDDGAARAPTAEQIAAAFGALETRLGGEKDDAVIGMILETLGRLKYADDQARGDVESLLVTQATGAPVRVLGAARGLEAFVRATPRRVIQPETRDRLRELAGLGWTALDASAASTENAADGTRDEALLARVRRLAMLALQTVRDDDGATLIKASRDADWQVRRIAALRVDPSRDEHAAAYRQLQTDRVFQVRYDVVTADAAIARRTHECGALLARVDDPVPTVAMHAVDLLPAGCADPAAVVGRLKALSQQLLTSGPGTSWQLPTRAALTLARLSPDSIGAVMSAMSVHPDWQVRAAAATLAGTTGANDVAKRLSSAGLANVRTAALEALALLKSPDLTLSATRALADPDHQLVRTAANVLKGTPQESRDDVNLALLAALERLTKIGADNSRDARLAIIQRLQELLPSEWSSRLNPFAADFDPRVRAAAIAAYEKILGSTVPPPGMPVHRYPARPGVTEFEALPAHARITMNPVGVIDLDLLVNDAPITVAKFVELVKAGYYNGLTFHRVVPNFVIQGGSRGANEYVGAPRFWRDEIGTVPHTRGAVGLSTRGHDTGDGQIFIDLVDLPRLDHDYTVFARVTAGLDVVDQILEGARIRSITTTVR